MALGHVSNTGYVPKFRNSRHTTRYFCDHSFKLTQLVACSGYHQVSGEREAAPEHVPLRISGHLVSSMFLADFIRKKVLAMLSPKN